MRNAMMLCLVLSGCTAELDLRGSGNGESSHALTNDWVPPIGEQYWTLEFGARGRNDEILVCNTDATHSDHAGHDYGSYGGAPVYAIGAGTVTIDPDKGTIVIEHPLDAREREALGLTVVHSAYWHVWRSVGTGDVVEAGEQIGTVQNQGDPHLHFEMRSHYPVQLPSGEDCPSYRVGIGYVPDIDDVRHPTQIGYLDPTATLGLLMDLDEEEDATPTPAPMPTPTPTPTDPPSCAERRNHCYLAGTVAQESEQTSCANEGGIANGEDGRAWQCVARDGALRWSQCFVTGDRATDRVASSIDVAGSSARLGTDGETCWACDRDATRENAVEYWEPRAAAECGAALCTGDGTVVPGESWELWEGCGDEAHLSEGLSTECYSVDASGAYTDPHHYECARYDFGGSTGERLVWVKRCGC